MLPVSAQVPVAGLYSSALDTGEKLALNPPATSTFPPGSRVAVCPPRLVVMLPVRAQVPVAGLYSSALLVPPPAASTWPSGSSVAVKPSRAVVMLPVGVHLPVAGLYSSALATVTDPKPDPATRTWPSARTVAASLTRAAFMLPVALKVPEVAASAGAATRPAPAASTASGMTYDQRNRIMICSFGVSCGLMVPAGGAREGTSGQPATSYAPEPFAAR